MTHVFGRLARGNNFMLMVLDIFIIANEPEELCPGLCKNSIACLVCKPILSSSTFYRLHQTYVRTRDPITFGLYPWFGTIPRLQYLILHKGERNWGRLDFIFVRSIIHFSEQNSVLSSFTLIILIGQDCPKMKLFQWK